MAKKPNQTTTPITSTRHNDKRTNIPTEELRDFVADEEKEPKSILYPRDPSLDPQLVWKGKDEQDQNPLEVPAVPIYIQEKISPQAIIENVRAEAKEQLNDQQLSLFNDFNNIAFEDLVDFYHHEQNWSNRMILGDSLLVMNSLAEKENLRGRVQMIYMDPPYGIKFGSNWQVSTRKRDVKDGKEDDLTRQPEQIKAFRDTWELGIHSYLAYLRDRLVVARELLTDSGSLFVQIGDENVHLVRNVLDEVFGSENFISSIATLKTSGKASEYLDPVYDTVIWYGKSKKIKYRQIFSWKVIGEEGATQYVSIQSFNGEERRLSKEELSNYKLIPEDWKVFASDNLTSQSASQTTLYDYKYQNKSFSSGKGGWKTNIEGMKNLEFAGRLRIIGNTLMYRRFFDDFPVSPINNIWRDVLMTGFSEEKLYVVQTSSKIIERCILMTTDSSDLVLDPTCGSGTTAYVAEQWGRRWITIDTSRVAIALARTRLMAGRYPYYLLRDSHEGLMKDAEISGQVPSSPSPTTFNDIRHGFVYKRVPHIMLRTIANNEEIDEIYEKYQDELEALRQEINELTAQQWEEWELPREIPVKLKHVEENAVKVKKLLTDWWQMRRQRQNEIDDSIARKADNEMLYDQPYEDNKKIRVTGPFTVESLSPHRVISSDIERPETEIDGQEKAISSTGFESMIIDNLRVAGVENTKKGERLKFSHLNAYAGVWLHAKGEYKEKDGSGKTVAVCIGPEHGTVSPDLIKEAAKEAVQGVGFDLLIILGFAFDPHVSEEIHRYGKLTVLPTRINPDLQMGNLLLKKSGVGNLFMVFGEPDVEINQLPENKLSVNIKGVDIYDPTTGEIRSSSTDEIACWFVDTNYNGESFFVRHAYFTGANDPYYKLKRALRAEVDDEAWNSLYSTTSYPFDIPETGKIAVKVINHYGDEVLKVYSL
jgi:adenine-specific DNA-methyltransferase